MYLNLLLHSISNFRYQGYTDIGSLLPTKINKDNVEILEKKGSSDDKKKYNAVFDAMSDYRRVD